VGAFYRVIEWKVLGNHVELHLMWAAALAVGASLMIALSLRALRVPVIHAWMIGALILVYPFSDSTRLWPSASFYSLNLMVGLVGFVVALHGLRATTRSSAVRFHVLALALYVTAVFFSEGIAPLILCASLGYAYVAGVGSALKRAPWDLVVVAAAVSIGVASNTTQTVVKRGAAVHHARSLLTGAGDLLIHSIVPLGSGSSGTDPSIYGISLGRVALVLAAAGVVAILTLLRVRRQVLPGFAMAAGACLVWIFAAYVVYVPAIEWYHPLLPGIGNRLNTLAAVGMAGLAYTWLVLIAYAICQLISGAHRQQFVRATRVASCVVALALGIGYTDVLRGHESIWIGEYSHEQQLVTEIHHLGSAWHGQTVYVSFGSNVNPVFVMGWDINGAMLFYHGGEFRYVTVVPYGTGLRCDATSVQLALPGMAVQRSSQYGSAVFVNAERHELTPIRDRAACDQMAGIDSGAVT